MRPLRVLGAIALLAVLAPAASAQSVTTDSRIKTFVYNANEVFTVTTHYGYQSNIEFGAREVIETISVGDRVGWQIIPAGRRLFIRAMEENAHTNMTVVTNKRAYQFDLRSSSADAVFGSEELTYVVRFFYPPETLPVSAPVPLPAAPVAAVAAPVTPVAVLPSALPPLAPTAPSSGDALNYRYTYSGDRALAPTRIYDDGRSTYFKLANGDSASFPVVSMLTARGESVPLTTRRTPEGLLAVDALAPRFSLRFGSREVIVYNEADGGAR